MLSLESSVKVTRNNGIKIIEQMRTAYARETVV